MNTHKTSDRQEESMRRDVVEEWKSGEVEASAESVEGN